MKDESTETGSGSGRRAGRRGRPSSSPRTTTEQRQHIKAWFAGRLPTEWFDGHDVVVDDEEVLVVGTLPGVGLSEESTDDERSTAQVSRILGHREDTRERRMQIADEAQAAFGRHVSWGASCEDTTLTFTTASVPVMTRLGIRERRVLDTFIDAGIARSRSEALAWCVRLVGKNEEEWLRDLRTAFEHVDEVRRAAHVLEDRRANRTEAWRV